MKRRRAPNHSHSSSANAVVRAFQTGEANPNSFTVVVVVVGERAFQNGEVRPKSLIMANAVRAFQNGEASPKIIHVGERCKGISKW